MNKFLSVFCGAALATTALIAAPATAQAAPQNIRIEIAQENAVEVRHRRDRRRGFYRHGRRHYYNGHRGYRHHRRGYRRHHGFWFPPAAFGFGIIAPQIVPRGVAPRGYRANHYAWCESRYRSYRLSDNTFQPYNGPRRQCISPYIR